MTLQRVTAILIFLLLSITLFSVKASHALPDRQHFSDEELLSGFQKTVFGVEYPFMSGNSGNFVKKFHAPVRIYLHNTAKKDRRPALRAFIARLNQNVKGVDIQIVPRQNEANFHVYIVDKDHYQQTVTNVIFKDNPTRVPGLCMVRVSADYKGILLSQAAIVSDENEFVFKRCMIEEIMQGLGPVNDNSTLPWSVFNDRSPHNSLLRHDVIILNMLYHRKIKAGMSPERVGFVMPHVLRDIRKRFP